MVELCPISGELFESSNGQLKNLLNPTSGKMRLPNSRHIGDLIKARFCDYQFLTFLSAILQWRPASRLTPDEALFHPWLADNSYKEKEKEKVEQGGNGSSSLVGEEVASTLDVKIETQASHPTPCSSKGFSKYTIKGLDPRERKG